MMKRAKAIPGDKVNLFQVDENIIPFSFGNSIFINQHLHTAEELQEIIRHEFVHVKQKHSVDIIWGEVLCLVNWYNPFAWLLKKSIRQNLEFIADNKVLENGIDKKQYQYLLLKVIGNNQFSIAPKFNFSSLKKRIAMMNKLKTAKLHLVRFLFILPLLAVILLSFRKQIGDSLMPERETARLAYDTIPGKQWNPKPTETEIDFVRRHPKVKNITWGYIIAVTRNDAGLPGKAGDALMTIHFKNGKWDMYNLGLPSDVEKFKKNYGEAPPVPPPYTRSHEPNSKGYELEIVDENGNCTVEVREGEEVLELILLNTWKENPELYEEKYGELPLISTVPPTPPVVVKLPENVKRIDVNFDRAEVWLKNGKEETYNLRVPSEKAGFEKKYGKIFPPAPVMEGHELELNAAQEANRGKIGDHFEINDDNKAHVRLKDGTIEEYDLSNAAERKKFETRYGKIIEVGVKAEGINEPVKVVEYPARTIVSNEPVTVTGYSLNKTVSNEPVTVTGHSLNKNVSNEPVVVTGYSLNKNVSNEPVTAISAEGTSTVITPTRIEGESGVTFLNEEGHIISGEEEILFTISKRTTQEQLKALVSEMKEKGIQLKFDKTEYKNGILVHIEGSTKFKDQNNNFSVTDFSKFIVTKVKNGEHIFIQIRIDKGKQVS